jgi:hypothetical protein
MYKTSSVVHAIPSYVRIVHIINVSAIFVNFCKEIFAKIQKLNIFVFTLMATEF